MLLTGQHLISDSVFVNNKEIFRAVNPATGEPLECEFAEGGSEEVAMAATLAERDFDLFRQTSGRKRCELLEAIANELLVLKDPIIERANLETGLPIPRLEGELGRTVNQLRMFSQLVVDDDYKLLRIDQAIPDRQPFPKPDLRLTQIPLGPIAIFGASNFPLAFSVAGGDTASALASGCPVIVKGHPAHPGTSELAGRAIHLAVKKTGLPAGVFSLIQGSGHDVGTALVKHPQIKAVAFTGSQAGGRALFNLAAARPDPIPVFAEMGSVNPVFCLPQALQENYQLLAGKYAESLTLGVGQFCTNPGLLFAVKGRELNAFVQAVELHLRRIEPLPMLHIGIKQNFNSKLKQLQTLRGVNRVGDHDFSSDEGCFVSPALLSLSAADFLGQPNVSEEIFGPSSIVVECESQDQMLILAKNLPGQLSATVHAASVEENFCRQLFTILEKKAGRLILNDFPTGVEVCSAMNHGGPYPATTDSRFTSVGSAAIGRFLRPVCYQNFYKELLPRELRDDQKFNKL
ncbi:MAG: aldehyde dehydrogenase (NADP(+)) [Desulfuromusa sp.]|nr:aldehyde dehydrogenase (NADP(+)) [Desulfuromusa sp.]